MASHILRDANGGEFEVVIDESQRITDVSGEWPAKDEVFTLAGPLPAHSIVEEVPERVRRHPAAKGREVCFYDPDSCRTCYCDDEGHMHCVGMC